MSETEPINPPIDLSIPLPVPLPVTLPVTLSTYLRTEARQSFQRLMKQVERTTEQEANLFRTNDWPDHRHGIGQDGSIGGIVYHLAAWKQLTLPLFERDSPPVSRQNFDPNSHPSVSDWPHLVEWLRNVGHAWLDRLDKLNDLDFFEPREWEGVTITLAEYVTEMYSHDIQHASQIEYLHQRIKLAVA
jgi:hypothetical protein